MRWPSEAVNAAVLAAAIGVDRTVEADVRRAVAGDDRFGMLDRDGGAALGDAIQRLDRVEPLALDRTLLQVEAGRGGVARCSAPADRLNRHPGRIGPLRNISRTNASAS